MKFLSILFIMVLGALPAANAATFRITATHNTTPEYNFQIVYNDTNGNGVLDIDEVVSYVVPVGFLGFVVDPNGANPPDPFALSTDPADWSFISSPDLAGISNFGNLAPEYNIQPLGPAWWFASLGEGWAVGEFASEYSYAVAAVPLPAAAWFFLTALFGAGWFRRRQVRAKLGVPQAA